MSNAYLKRKAREQWYFWRPIVLGVLTYTEASQMYEEELLECNIAIDEFSPYGGEK